MFENPGWYTPYTPYQAEIAQGRLESLLNFQTMVTDLTGMEVANASLLDEATAAAEAMALLHRAHTTPRGAERFWSRADVPAGRCPALEARAAARRCHDPRRRSNDDGRFGPMSSARIVQSPDDHGGAVDLETLIERAHEAGALVAVGTDLLALAIVVTPGRDGRRRGRGQRPALWRAAGIRRPACGVLRDARAIRPAGAGAHHRRLGRRPWHAARIAWRCQTREQHIRREKATSNICTAQALLANMAAMYAVYHGPKGLTAIAQRVHPLARARERRWPRSDDGRPMRATSTRCALKVRR